MADLLLAGVMAAVFLFGYFAVNRLDSFLQQLEGPKRSEDSFWPEDPCTDFLDSDRE